MRLTRFGTLAVAAILLTSPAIAQGGAFGVEGGKSPETYGCAPYDGHPSHMECRKVPNPHPAFDGYAVWHHPAHGVCSITGIGKSIEESGAGSRSRAEFARLREQIGSIYAQSRVVDEILPGALWDGPNEWLMSIHKSERLYGALWDRSTGAKLPDHIHNIDARVNSIGPRIGYVNVTYRFSNWTACKAAIDAVGQDAF